jgi:hypothetical protein
VTTLALVRVARQLLAALIWDAAARVATDVSAVADPEADGAHRDCPGGLRE